MFPDHFLFKYPPPLLLFPLQTWPFKGGLNVCDVFLIQKNLNTLGRILRQLYNFPGDLAHYLRVEVLHVGTGWL